MTDDTDSTMIYYTNEGDHESLEAARKAAQAHADRWNVPTTVFVQRADGRCEVVEQVDPKRGGKK